jgi:hypothetical protein
VTSKIVRVSFTQYESALAARRAMAPEGTDSVRVGSPCDARVTATPIISSVYSRAKGGISALPRELVKPPKPALELTKFTGTIVLGCVLLLAATVKADRPKDRKALAHELTKDNAPSLSPRKREYCEHHMVLTLGESGVRHLDFRH